MIDGHSGHRASGAGHREAPAPAARPPEGWGWIYGAVRWHYFRNFQSLCRKWEIFYNDSLDPGNNDSPDNCKRCRKRLEAEHAHKS